MIRRNVRLFVLLCVMLVVVCAAVAVIASRLRGVPSTAESPVMAEASEGKSAQIPPSRAHMPYPFAVSPSRLRPQLRAPFGVLGDRLARPGKERLTLAGSLRRAVSSLTEQVRVTHESPNLLVAEGETRALASFDEREAMRGDRAVGEEEELIVETLLYDSAEHFFFAQARGAATRFLGSRAVPEGAGAGYRGPFYDVYEVTEGVAAGGVMRPKTKRYFFNSDTQLLEVVRYEVERGGNHVSVEVRVGGWRRVQGQQVPTSFERLEGGRTVFSFTASSAALGPRGRSAPRDAPRRQPT